MSRPKGLNARVAEIGRLYADGRTQGEIALVFGVSQTGVGRLMRRHGIQARPRGAHRVPMRGSAHPNWKGDDASYTSYHERVYRRQGKPQRCERCGTTDPAKTYDWANLTGNYGNPDDYERMCRSCHRRYDSTRPKGAKAALACR